jgi:hypothetical protein
MSSWVVVVVVVVQGQVAKPSDCQHGRGASCVLAPKRVNGQGRASGDGDFGNFLRQNYSE